MHWISNPCFGIAKWAKLSVLVFLLTASTSLAFFRNMDEFGDTVVILSRGLSGSTWFCEIVKNTYPFKGPSNINLNKELFGTTVDQMKALQDPLEKMIRYLGDQRRACPECLIGFKWKPDFDSWRYNSSRFWLAEKRIPVLYVHRNPIDLLISKLKHNISSSLEYHCAPGQEECIKMHKNVRVNVNLNTVIPLLQKYHMEKYSIPMQLFRTGANFMTVSYENLAFSNDDDRLRLLQAIIDFVYPGDNGITANMSFFRTQFELTNQRNHSLQISNYAKLVRKLKGSPYAVYLN
jgi:hypothetical protein